MTHNYHASIAALFPLVLMRGADEEGIPQAVFLSGGIAVSNPRQSTCSRFEVSPAQYGLSDEQADAMIGLNKAIKDVARIVMDVAKAASTMKVFSDDATGQMINAGAAAIQNQLGVETGDFASLHFSGEEIESQVNKIYAAIYSRPLSAESETEVANKLRGIFMDYALAEIAFAQREAGADENTSGHESNQFFVIQISEDDLPTLHGPFLTKDAMLTAARAIRAESPEDNLVHIDVPKGIEPSIGGFTDAMLETKEPFIEAMAEGLRRGEAVITRLNVLGIGYFTGLYQGDEVVITDELADILAEETGETIYIVQEHGLEVAMTGRNAMQRFTESDWIEKVKAGETVQGLHTWRLEQLAKLTKLASWK